tara:strand:+ start:212 stop:541 length:330 start_codon:yes stop_codon:yes gene_type:complete
MKNKIKYELRTHGNVFKIFETYTKKYIIEGTNRKEAANVTRFLNNGGAFKGNTPNFFINDGPIKLNEEIYTRKPTHNKIKQKARFKRTRNNNQRRKKEHVLPLSGNTWS